ncbi:17512_t:CDS:1, partial [Acaulospora colombiana]
LNDFDKPRNMSPRKHVVDNYRLKRIRAGKLLGTQRWKWSYRVVAVRK